MSERMTSERRKDIEEHVAWSFPYAGISGELLNELNAVTAERDDVRQELSQAYEAKDGWEQDSNACNRELYEARQSLALSRAEGARLRKALEVQSIAHLQGCSFGYAVGDEGDVCSCFRRERRLAKEAALTSSPAPLLEAVRGAMDNAEAVLNTIKLYHSACECPDTETCAKLGDSWMCESCLCDEGTAALDALKKALGGV